MTARPEKPGARREGSTMARTTNDTRTAGALALASLDAIAHAVGALPMEERNARIAALNDLRALLEHADNESVRANDAEQAWEMAMAERDEATLANACAMGEREDAERWLRAAEAERDALRVIVEQVAWRYETQETAGVLAVITHDLGQAARAALALGKEGGK